MPTFRHTALREVIDREPEYVRIPVKLSKKDIEDVRRILDGRYEPLEDAELYVRVKEKK